MLLVAMSTGACRQNECIRSDSILKNNVLMMSRDYKSGRGSPVRN